MTKFLIKSATLADGSTKDIQIEEGFITDIQDSIQSDAEVINASGLIALNGFVDLHTHLREPGFEASETILTGSKVAAKGGYTCVHAMANTNPVADNASVVEQVFALGVEAGYVHVQPVGAITLNLEGDQLSDMGKMNKSSAQVKLFSDDGKCVSDSLVMRRALEYVKAFDGVIAQHAQDPKLTQNAQMNEGPVSLELGLAGWPAVAEAAIIARDALLAEEVDSKLHVCHVSTRKSVDVIRWAKARGIRITAEVTPHHLLLTDDLARGYDPVFKVNPPLRTADDVQALREAVADGTIDVIATDHAPHTAENKECEWAEAAFGMLGLEQAAAVVQTTLVDTGLISWTKFEEIMSLKPAEIGGQVSQGAGIKVGSPANITLLDPNFERVVEPHGQSKSANNPYRGLTLKGDVKHVFYRGVQTVKDSEVVSLEKK